MASTCSFRLLRLCSSSTHRCKHVSKRVTSSFRSPSSTHTSSFASSGDRLSRDDVWGFGVARGAGSGEGLGLGFDPLSIGLPVIIRVFLWSSGYVWVLGCGVWGLGFGVWGLGFG